MAPSTYLLAAYRSCSLASARHLFVWLYPSPVRTPRVRTRRFTLFPASVLTSSSKVLSPSYARKVYVIHSLQTVLHDALEADSAEEAIITAVNRGGDTDTIGAITGAIAGARFGVDDLPEDWLSVLDGQQELSRIASALQEL